MTEVALPEEVAQVARAIAALRKRYDGTGLTFTPDGNLVGDLGEAIAVEHFGMKLAKRGAAGIDGTLPDGRSVQVKATGRGTSVAFTHTGVEPDALLVLKIDFTNAHYSVVYNGPYAPVRALLPETWKGQRSRSVNKIAALQAVEGRGSDS